MTDLLVFVAIVGLVVVIGIVIGMIVAARLDRLLTPRSAVRADETALTTEDAE